MPGAARADRRARRRCREGRRCAVGGSRAQLPHAPLDLGYRRCGSHEARSRLGIAVQALKERGLDARGEVGDADPLNAINDALHSFEADEVIVSTHPAGKSHWLEKDLVGRAREAVRVPVTHMVSAYGLEDAEKAPAAA